MSQCNDIRLAEALEELDIDLARIHKWVHGSESEQVNLGGVNTDTIRKLVKTYWRTATKNRLGVVRIGDGLSVNADGLIAVAVAAGSGISLDADGNLTIDPSAWSQELTEQIMQQIRVPFWLTRNTTWYVRSDGNDNNDGSADTPAKAFKTIGAALSHVSSNYNMDRYNATIQVAAGTYPRFTLPKYSAGTGSITIAGAGKNSTIVSAEQAVAIAAASGAGDYTLRDMSIVTSKAETGTQACVNISVSGVNVALINCSLKFSCAIDNAAGPQCLIRVVSGSQVSISYIAGSTVDLEAVYTGGGDSQISGLRTESGGGITIMNDMVFTGQYAASVYAMTLSSIRVASPVVGYSPAMSGNAAGLRYRVSGNSVINTGARSEDYFPGTQDGVKSSGGQYI